jgi:aspartyl-tRNA(Asn)/glutamyl-tRNA(Gln) amidotransferase subunit B
VTSTIDGYEVVVGLEVHVQLLTNAKLFSPAPTSFGGEPNAHVDVVDAGLPGVLPVLNGRAVELAIRLGLALGSTVRPRSVFARKHYFYPDLPKGYQISQYEEPVVEGGSLDVTVGAGAKATTTRVRITRAHLEEDAGKSLHVEGTDATFLDFNRAGTPLLEVVTEPDLRSADEAEAFFRALRALVVAIGVCDGNLQEGSMRADANVSVRRPATALGTRVELKNINSPRFLNAAIDNEARRQIAVLEGGGRIVQETRLWDADRRESRSMRTKEDAHDYRYAPDPDLPPLTIRAEEIAAVKSRMPELPDARRARYETRGLSAYDARVLSSEAGVARFFDDALAVHDNAKGIANWVINEVLRVVNERSLDPDEVAQVLAPATLARLVALVDAGTITGKIAKDAFAVLIADPALRASDPAALVAERGWGVMRDTGAVERAVDEAIAESPGEWKKLLDGKPKVIGYFVGQVMKKTGGKADPKDINRLIEERKARPT